VTPSHEILPEAAHVGVDGFATPESLTPSHEALRV